VIWFGIFCVAAIALSLWALSCESKLVGG